MFQLSPSSSTWTKSTIYNFQDNDIGQFPWGGVIADATGILYGSTWQGGANGGGALFKLTRSGSWTALLLHAFDGYYGPWGSLSIDRNGNLYGTVHSDGPNHYGSVFELTPQGEYTDFHHFTGGGDGGYPMSSIALDSNGNLFGTTSIGGANGYGEVFEVTRH